MAINAMETVFHYLLIITFIIAALAFLLSIIARRFTLLSLLVIPTVLYLMNVIDVMFATTLVFILACVCEWILRVTKGES